MCAYRWFIYGRYLMVCGSSGELPKLSTDSIGRLNEWDMEREEFALGHRHLSHLYGLYPGQLFEKDSVEWKAAER